MSDPDQNSSSGLLAFVPETVNAVSNLIEKVWDKSPYLGHVVVLLVVLLPFYAVYTWGNISRVEKQIDEKLQKAKKTKTKSK